MDRTDSFSQCAWCGRGDRDTVLLKPTLPHQVPVCVDWMLFERCPVEVGTLIDWLRGDGVGDVLSPCAIVAIDMRWREVAGGEGGLPVELRCSCVDCRGVGDICEECGEYVPTTTGSETT